MYQLDVQIDEWDNFVFSQFDVVFNVAGLAHRKITPDIEPLYYTVNRDLTERISLKSKDSGVKQFLFMSSISVYSDDLTYVNYDSPIKPDNAYGKRKLQAEEIILSEFIFQLNVNPQDGIFYPQNEELANTTEYSRRTWQKCICICCTRMFRKVGKVYSED